MSGVVRRQQPLNKTMTGAAGADLSAEGDALNATAPDGGVATSQNQSGVISANRISFYPTSPARQSYMQTGNKGFYKQPNNFHSSHRNTTTS